MTNVYFNLKLRIWKHDMPCALKKIMMAEVSGAYKPACECYKCFSWYKLNLLHNEPHAPDFNKFINVLHGENLALFTVTSFQSLQKSTGNRNSEIRWNPRWKATKNSSSNRSNDRKIEFINKEVYRKKKEKVFITRIWLIHNTKVISH